MIEQLRFRLLVWWNRASNRVWIGPALTVLVGISLCGLAWVADRIVDEDRVPHVAVEGVENILSIISSSMLTVATFALGTLVTALAFAATNATPRATELLIRDEGGRAAISAFIGSFVFAVIAETALSFEIYGPVGQLALLILTLAVLAYLVGRLVLFVRTMTRLGRMSDTTDRIAAATRASLRRYRRHPYPAPTREFDEISDDCEKIAFTKTGYVTHFDIDHLVGIARHLGVTLHVQVRPGAFVTPGQTAVVVETPPSTNLTDSQRSTIIETFVVAAGRSFDHDPRFGFLTLSEVAQRALSPAVNDSGTAIAVANAVAALILNPDHDRPPTPHDQSLAPISNLATIEGVTVVRLNEAEFVHDAFAPIIRDGASNVQLLERLLKLLAAIATNTDGAMSEAAIAEGAVLLERARMTLSLTSEREHIEAVHRRRFGPLTMTSPENPRPHR